MYDDFSPSGRGDRPALRPALHRRAGASTRRRAAVLAPAGPRRRAAPGPAAACTSTPLPTTTADAARSGRLARRPEHGRRHRRSARPGLPASTCSTWRSPRPAAGRASTSRSAARACARRGTRGGERTLLARDVEIVHGVRVTRRLRTGSTWPGSRSRVRGIAALDAAARGLSRIRPTAELDRSRCRFRGHAASSSCAIWHRSPTVAPSHRPSRCSGCCGSTPACPARAPGHGP